MKCNNCNGQLTETKLKYRTARYCDKCDLFEVEERETCCDDTNFVFVRYNNQDLSSTLRRQCKNCGFKENKIYKKSDVQRFDFLPLFSQDLENKRLEDIKSEYEFIQNMRSNKFFRDHAEYMRSNQWRLKRKLVLERDRYLCQSCLVDRATEVHHKQYTYWKNEPLFTLVSLCHQCHDKITDMDRLSRDRKPIDSVEKIIHSEF
jgi:hypothetical protein